MSDWLMIEVYPENGLQGEQIDELLQEAMADEGVRGSVIVSWVMPDILAKMGISRLPAIVIGRQVFMQGRIPTRTEIISWFEKIVMPEDLAPKHDPGKSGWPSTLSDAVIWLVEGMTEKEKIDVAAADDEDLCLANGPGGWGQGIRNGYGLWAGNRELLRDCGTKTPTKHHL